MEPVEQNLSELKKQAIIKHMSKLALKGKGKKAIDRSLRRKFNIKIK